jgi:hypothetical protein
MGGKRIKAVCPEREGVPRLPVKTGRRENKSEMKMKMKMTIIKERKRVQSCSRHGSRI